ncbi:hypothetical protein [Pseudomonas soli]|uniref:hypothetical protein n=1 Tax=Pseudomonas soli TaxID=1306993 RepID=UPI0003C78D31|nr:hypothetical protein O165_006395 [Pseudomonas soli]
MSASRDDLDRALYVAYAEIDTLRAQLAERDALLRRWLSDAYIIDPKKASLAMETEAALSSSAQRKVGNSELSVVPVERDERAEFEADWAHRMKVAGHRERANAFYRIQPNDRYRWNDVQDAWEAWQARAALERNS